MLKCSYPSLCVVILITILIVSLSGCGGGASTTPAGGATLASVTLMPLNPSISLAQGAIVTFDVIGTYSFGNPRDITTQMTWSSRDTTVATVSAKGVATAVNSGRVIIVGRIQDPQTLEIFQVSTTLTVVPQLTGIAISPASAQIAEGTSQQFTATGKYNDGTTPDITALVSWNSSQQGTASVSSSPGTQGLAVASTAGTARITASIGSVSSPPAILTVSSAKLVSLAIAPQSPSFGLSASEQLVATGTFDDSTTQDLSRQVIWTTATSPSPVVRVSATGVATGIGLGNETVLATFPASTLQNTATVAVDESSVQDVRILPFPMVMFLGAQYPLPFMANGTDQQMRALAVFNNGSTEDVTHIQGVSWNSENPAVATVDSLSGQMMAVGPGATNIVASLGSRQGSTSVNVANAQLQSLVVAPNNTTLVQGGRQDIVAVATFLGTDNQTKFQQDVSEQSSWSSDNDAVATVDDLMGLQKMVQGIGPGSANVSARFTIPGGATATSSSAISIISGGLSSISLAPANSSVPLDGGHQYSATGIFTDGTKEDLTLFANWSASNNTIATLSSVGYADASGPGQTGVTAKFNDQSASTPLLVNPGAISRIDICASTVSSPLTNCPPLDPIQPPLGISFANQTMFGLVAIGTFTDGSRQDLTDAVRWSSSTPGAASISNDSSLPGLATGIGQRGVLTGGVTGGTAAITAQAGGITSTVNVEATPATIQQLEISPNDGLIPVGTPFQYIVTALFSDGSKQDLTQQVLWSSLNPDVAVVAKGGIAYSTGNGIANVSLDPSSLTIAANVDSISMQNPSATTVFPWPVGSIFQLHSLTVTSGNVSPLVNVPFTILSETDPTDPQHQQPCKIGQSCELWFAPPALSPAAGIYTLTAGTGQVSALITATMDVEVNSIPTLISGSTTLTVQ